MKILKSLFRNLFLNTIKKFRIWKKLFYLPLGVTRIELLMGKSTMIKYYSSEDKLEKVNRKIPIHLENKLHWKFELFKNLFSEKNFVIESKNWTVWGNQGCVITNEGFVLEDVSREFSNVEHSIFQQIKLIKPAYSNGVTAVIAASGSNVYYHWMIDILPRIQLLKDTGNFDKIEKFILNFQRLPFQEESLKKLGIEKKKIVTPKDNWTFHLTCETLIVPSFLSPIDVVPIYTINFLRKTFLNKRSSVNDNVQKLYVKRRSGRQIINEREIEGYLKCQGFTSVFLEDYNIENQAEIFNNATYIVGAHGAGFTNLVFCESQTKVIDIFSPNWVNPCYWTIASELNLDYRYIIGEGRNPVDGFDPLGKGDSILVSLEKLKLVMAI